MNRVDQKLLGVVLCGGQSRRMGRDKACLTTRSGKSFLDRATDRLAACCDAVAVSATNDRETDHPLIPDPVPSFGPISGVYASLIYAAESGFDACLINPVDTPNLSTDDLDRLISAYRSDPKIVYGFAGDDPSDVQPLIAIYPVTSAATLSDRIRLQRYSLRRLLLENDCHRVSLTSAACRNMNTPDDLDHLTDHL